MDRKTLTEMVEKIRSEEVARRSLSTERASTPNRDFSVDASVEPKDENSSLPLGSLLQKAGLLNGNGHTITSEPGNSNVGILSKTGNREAILYHSTPYASMVGVVLIGMGLMAYLNGWQPPKADR